MKSHMESQLFRMHQDLWSLFTWLANDILSMFAVGLFAVAIGLFFLSRRQKRSTVLPRFLFAVGLLLASLQVVLIIAFYITSVYGTQKKVVDQVVKEYRLNPTSFERLRCHEGKWQYKPDKGLPYQSFEPTKSCAKDRGLRARFDEFWQKDG